MGDSHAVKCGWCSRCASSDRKRRKATQSGEKQSESIRFFSRITGLKFVNARQNLNIQAIGVNDSVGNWRPAASPLSVSECPRDWSPQPRRTRQWDVCNRMCNRICGECQAISHMTGLDAINTCEGTHSTHAPVVGSTQTAQLRLFNKIAKHSFKKSARGRFYSIFLLTNEPLHGVLNLAKVLT